MPRRPRNRRKLSRNGDRDGNSGTPNRLGDKTTPPGGFYQKQGRSAADKSAAGHRVRGGSKSIPQTNRNSGERRQQRYVQGQHHSVRGRGAYINPSNGERRRQWSRSHRQDPAPLHHGRQQQQQQQQQQRQQKTRDHQKQLQQGEWRYVRSGNWLDGSVSHDNRSRHPEAPHPVDPDKMDWELSPRVEFVHHYCVCAVCLARDVESTSAAIPKKFAQDVGEVKIPQGSSGSVRSAAGDRCRDLESGLCWNTNRHASGADQEVFVAWHLTSKRRSDGWHNPDHAQRENGDVFRGSADSGGGSESESEDDDGYECWEGSYPSTADGGVLQKSSLESDSLMPSDAPHQRAPTVVHHERDRDVPMTEAHGYHKPYIVEVVDED